MNSFDRAQEDYLAPPEPQASECPRCKDVKDLYEFHGDWYCEGCCNELQQAYEACFKSGWESRRGILFITFDYPTALKWRDLVAIDDDVAYVETDWIDILEAQAQNVADRLAL